MAVAALILYGVMLLGAAYGEASTAMAALHLRKYADLLLIPVFLSLFRDAALRRQGIYALAASLALILFLSYLTKAGLIPPNPVTAGTPDYPVVFKMHLTHNILMAFAAYLFAWLALEARSLTSRTGWAALAVLAVVNVTVLVYGATGYLVLGALFFLFGYRSLGWRGAGVAVVSLTLLGAILMATPGHFQRRIAKIEQELMESRADRPADTSTALRLEFYRNTLAMIAERPLLGAGTGAFAAAYAEKVKGTAMAATQNPHNEFLLVAAQLGAVGLAALIWLFASQWWLAARLPARLEQELARGLVATMVVGCMLNALLLDHTEGLLYAWLTGVLFGGLESRPEQDRRND